MMGRMARVVAVGCPHDLTQRGNFRRDVLFDDEDRQPYLELLLDVEACSLDCRALSVRLMVRTPCAM